MRDIITIGVIVLIYLLIRGDGGLHDSSISIPLGLKAVFVIIMAVLLCYSLGRRVKKLLRLGQQVKHEHIPTSEADHPWLDSQSLSRWTAELEALGFVRLNDFTVHYLTEGVSNLQFFTRLMLHPVERCIASSINMFVPSANRFTSQEGITSCFEDGWDISTTRSKPNWVAYLINMPKENWSSHPNAAPKELFEIHLKQCRRFSSDMGLRNVTGATAEEYFAWQKKLEDPRREMLKKRPALVFFINWIMFLAFHPAKGGSAYAAALKKMRK